MNIGFHLQIPNEVIYSWDEIVKLGLEEEQDKDTYCAAKALNFHKDFTRLVIAKRIEAGIPEEGISYTEYESLSKLAQSNREEIKKLKSDREEYFKALEQRANAQDKIFNAYRAAVSLVQDFTFHPLLLPHLHTIFFANFVELKAKIQLDISFKDPEDFKSEVVSVDIRIYRPTTTSELKTFITDHAQDIAEATKRLPFIESSGKRWSHFYISERDFEILRMKDRDGDRFPEIADKLQALQDLTNEDKVINEESVKRAYHEIIDTRLPWIIKKVR